MREGGGGEGRERGTLHHACTYKELDYIYMYIGVFYFCDFFFACRAASLEREKSISLQQLLNEKDEVLSSLKKQYEKMVEARVER